MGEEQPRKDQRVQSSMAGEESGEAQSQCEATEGGEKSGRSEFSHPRAGESEGAERAEERGGECVVVSREWLRGIVERAYHAGAKDVMDGVYQKDI